MNMMKVLLLFSSFSKLKSPLQGLSFSTLLLLAAHIFCEAQFCLILRRFAAKLNSFEVIAGHFENPRLLQEAAQKCSRGLIYAQCRRVEGFYIGGC